MVLCNGRFNGLVIPAAGFDDQQMFLSGFYLALPCINRSNAGHNVNARCQFFFNKSPGESFCSVVIGAGAKQ